MKEYLKEFNINIRSLQQEVILIKRETKEQYLEPKIKHEKNTTS